MERNWRELIVDFDEAKFQSITPHLLPFYDNSQDKLEKLINLAVVFSCQPALIPNPRDGKDEIRTMDSLINFLRSLWQVL